jgi:hypothetical protein
VGQKLVSPAAYWRRRVVSLATSLAVLTLLAWGANWALASIQASARGAPQAYTSHVAARHTRVRAEPALTGEAADLGFRQRPTTTQPAPPSAPSTTPSPAPGQQPCVVLTIRSGQSKYGPGQPATFEVRAVSTRSRPCRVNLGSRFASVVVSSAGTPIWDSSSCLRGTGSRVVTLRRGVPAFLRVTWDRRTSLSGCPGKGKAAPSGSYTAAAFDGQLRSDPTAFVLSGRAAPVH